MSDRSALYLHVPEVYFIRMGFGLRWSEDGEVVMFDDGRTFAFAGAIAGMVEGFASQRPLIHFGHILHLLRILDGVSCTLNNPGEATRLHAAFRAAGKQYRNAGAFFGVVCADVPAVAEWVSSAEVARAFVLRPFGTTLDASALQPGIREMPPLGPTAFEAAVLRATAGHDDEALRDWFRNGRGPVADAGAAVAEVVRRAPRTLDDALDDAARRQRLAGAAAFVEQLTSALSLPPRRLARPEAPLGGYADVTNRGGPEQILPSQFALDDLEFVRRCAENELLYYRREEPHDRKREDLVVLLDQGVHTWGSVRLVLSAAVFALGRLAGARRAPFLVAATCTRGVLQDPSEMNEDAFASLLEASDLTANPGLALETLLSEQTDAARDIVLLTHPRNLGEPDVQAAARRLRPGTRLFAVAVDDHGDVEFSEVRRGAPVRLSRFHVDLNRTAAPPPIRPPPQDGCGPWRGEVEPYGFPFVFGVARRGPLLFDMDQAGKWLVTATGNGMLHATRTDGSHTEVLPRVVMDGHALADIRAVLGVVDGVAVVGMAPGALPVVAHYDLVHRICTTHLMGRLKSALGKCVYYRDLHSVVLGADGSLRAVDLGTGGRLLEAGFADDRVSRAKEACDRAQVQWASRPGPTGYLRLRGGETERIHLAFDSGQVILEGIDVPWQAFTPLSDGRPMLQGCRLIEAYRRQGTLALVVDGSRVEHDYGGARLCLFRGQEGIPLAVYPCLRSPGPFTLSSDGRLLAMLTRANQLEVRDAGTSGPPLCVTCVGGFSRNPAATIGDRWLLLRVRQTAHLIRWSHGILDCWHKQGLTAAFVRERLDGTTLSPEGVAAQPGRLPRWLAYDPARFRLTAHGRLIVVVDACGQTLVFEPNGALVCMFFVYGGNLAGWAPPDVRFGPTSLLGAPATPGAGERIGRALLAAWERSEARSP